MATVTAHALARIYENAEKNLSDNFTPSVQIKQIMISDRIKKYYTAIITDGSNYVHGQIAIDLTKKGIQDGSIICVTDYGIEQIATRIALIIDDLKVIQKESHIIGEENLVRLPASIAKPVLLSSKFQTNICYLQYS